MTWISCYPWRSPQGWPRQRSSPSTDPISPSSKMRLPMMKAPTCSYASLKTSSSRYPGGSVSRARLPGRRPTSEYGVLLHQGRSLGPAMKPSRDIPTSSGTLLTVRLSGPFPLLLDDPEGHVGHVWISYQLDPLQFDMFGPEVIEQPDAVPQQHGDHALRHCWTRLAAPTATFFSPAAALA
jgi:hypothetical protein